MAVRIRLKRLGKIRNPQYRIVVADARTKRDGRVIEEIGQYRPKEDPSYIEVNSERAQYWLSVGAQPSDPVRVILSRTGDWQKFKGLPAPEPLKVAAPKADRQARYEAEAKAAGVDQKPDKPEPRAERRRPSKRAESAKPESAKAEPAKTAEPAKSESARSEPARSEPAKKSQPKAETEGKAAADAGAES